ncbi:Protein C48B4.1 [Aphelenchoides avenae]|nr:Protein C48B4.1 [Aphelenchus avenae]
MNRYIRDGDNPDLTEERRKAAFDTEALCALVWDGAQNLRRRREINAFLESRPELQDAKPLTFMSREEMLENESRKVVERLKHVSKFVDVNDPDSIEDYNQFLGGIGVHPWGLHFGASVPALINNCDEEQYAQLVPKVMSCAILSAYAQTELGHGTNLKKLETTAIYDPKTQEFVLNTSTVTATKWWPGNMGKCANHVVVVAQLYTGGKCYGPHPFWLQIRDLQTHEPLKGITLGDIGPKMGINFNDHGFLRIDNVRIPRRNLLMKYAKVLPDGTYIPPIHDKLGYSSMTAGEVKVIDYQTQQWRLFPQLARAFAFLFAGNYVRDLYFSVFKDMGADQVRAIRISADYVQFQIAILADLHAVSSGLKAVVTHQASLGIEQCRMACGGHGYADASGLPLLYVSTVAGCTYEGENMVMLQQLARYLMKQAAAVRLGTSKKNPSPLVAYLFRDGPSKCRIDVTASNVNYESLLEAFEHASKRGTLAAFDRLSDLVRDGMDEKVAWNEVAVDLTKASRAHTRAFVARQFVEAVGKVTEAKLRSVLKDLLDLYLRYELLECSATLLEDGFVTSEQLAHIRRTTYDCLKRVRPNALSIVDAWDFSDRELYSVLGRRDGHVYANLLKWAQENPINKHEVLPFHHKYLGKFMEERQRMSKI